MFTVKMTALKIEESGEVSVRVHSAAADILSIQHKRISNSTFTFTDPMRSPTSPACSRTRTVTRALHTSGACKYSAITVINQIYT
jgi:hypothetical protein